MQRSDRPHVVAISGLVIVLLAAWSPTGATEGNAPAIAGFETPNFRGAAACAPCHSAIGTKPGPGSGRNDSPAMVDRWSGSIMAYGSIDPFWRAKVQSEVLRAPDHRELIEGKCAPCHTPMAATEATFAGGDVLLFENGFLEPEHPLHDAALDAISCTLCHRIEDDDSLGTDEGFSGKYTIDPVNTPENRPHYGPCADTFDQPMIASVGLRNHFGGQINDPALCAACHNLKTPFLDAQGQIVGTDFPEQMPFGEWQQSVYPFLEDPIGCQQCHMPLDDEGRIAHRPRWLPKRDRASHAFVSANTEILSLLAVEAALLGHDPEPLLASAEAGRDFLTHAGALEVLDASLSAEALEFRIEVRNETGHKLPTAFPSRRVYLHTVVSDDFGEIVFESGATLADGRIVGVDTDDDPSTFEPHHDIITLADEVQVYEAILGSTDDEVTFTLLRAGQYLKDNRLVPVGFDPSNVPDDVRPSADCMNDLDFGFGRDEVTYRIDGLPGSHYQVTIELRHQAIGYPYVTDLREFAADPVIGRFLDLYDAVQPGSELIAEIVFDVGS